MHTTFPALEDCKPLDPPQTVREGRWPVLIFSHGLGGTRNAYSHLCGSLASHGLVVAVPEHRDGSGPISFINEADKSKRKAIEYRAISHTQTPEVEEARDEQLKIRCWELGLLHEALLKIDLGEQLTNLLRPETSSTPSPHTPVSAFRSKLDIHTPGKISWSGHSFGATTMVQFIKSVFYPGIAPLYTSSPSYALSRQITSASPISLLDLWTLPLLSRATSALREKPLPAYTVNDTRPSPPLTILSDGFYKWRSNLLNTLEIVCPPGTDSSPTTPTSVRPDIFYALHSAHLSQSDFGVLFPWLTKRFLKAEEPERLLRLNVRAILESLRRRGVSVADTSALDREIVDKDSEGHAVPELVNHGGEKREDGADGSALGQDHAILAKHGGVRGWVALDPIKEFKRLNGDEKNEGQEDKKANGEVIGEPKGPADAVMKNEVMK